MKQINIIDKYFIKHYYEKDIIIKIILFFSLIFFYYKSSYISRIRKIINNNNDVSQISTMDKIANFSVNTSKNINDGNLYWNNQKSLNIDNVLNEIKLFTPQISFERKTDFEKRENPKISLVITLHNHEKNIKSLYASIQKQKLKDLEIIFVDDFSEDNTSSLITKLMNIDKRIVYLKNDKNKGAFYSRNRGIISSKGEYLICLDADDLLLNDILIKAFETAKLYNLDIVQFYALTGSYKSPKLWKALKGKGGILKNNSEIRANFYNCISRNLWDKLVRTSIFKESVHFMKKEFCDQLYYINNDDTAFFGLLHIVRTYGFLEQIGYFYISRPFGTYYYILINNWQCSESFCNM